MEDNNRNSEWDFPFLRVEWNSFPVKVTRFVRRHPLLSEFFEYNAITAMFILMFLGSAAICGFSIRAATGITSASMFSNFKGMFLFSSGLASGQIVFVSSIIGFIIAIFVHEVGHGISIVSNGKKVEKFGLLFFLGIPVFAYVESPGEETLREILTVYSSGVFANFLIVIGTIGLFKLPFTASFSSVFFTYTGLLFSQSTPPSFTTTGIFSQFVFWVFIMNLNFALLNALPIYKLDGGQLLLRSIQISSNNEQLRRVSKSGLLALNIAVLIAFGLIIFA